MADKMRSTNIPLSCAPSELFLFAFKCRSQTGEMTHRHFLQTFWRVSLSHSVTKRYTFPLRRLFSPAGTAFAQLLALAQERKQKT